MFGVNGVSPAQIGLVLTYVVEITTVLSAVTVRELSDAFSA
jgi:hypothetical protein